MTLLIELVDLRGKPLNNNSTNWTTKSDVNIGETARLKFDDRWVMSFARWLRTTRADILGSLVSLPRSRCIDARVETRRFINWKVDRKRRIEQLETARNSRRSATLLIRPRRFILAVKRGGVRKFVHPAARGCWKRSRRSGASPVRELGKDWDWRGCLGSYDGRVNQAAAR